MKSEPTTFQRDIATALGLDIEGDSRSVAAARIREYVAPAIHEKSYEEPATGKQVAYGAVLGLELSGLSKGITSAHIDDRHSELNSEALEKLDLKPGDVVIHTNTFRNDDGDFSYEQEYVVSSIGKDGLVYFKGGNGRCGWPTQLRHVEQDSAERQAPPHGLKS